MQTYSPGRGIAAMVLATLTFVCNDSFLKTIVTDVPPLQAIFMRGVVATCWCLVLLGVMGHLPKVSLAFSPWTILRSLCELVAVVAFVTALSRVRLADISAIIQIAPLMLISGASFFWGERVGLLRWMLIAIGVGGAVFVAQPGVEGSSPYALLGFVTAAGSAGRDLLSRKVPHHVPGLVVTFAVILVVMICAGVGSLVFERMVQPTTWQITASIGAGFFLVFGQFFAFMAFRLAPASSVAPFFYSFTLFAVLIGYVIFGEIPNRLAIVGICLIVVCGLGVILLEQRKGRLL